jgi:hypothetical protein
MPQHTFDDGDTLPYFLRNTVPSQITRTPEANPGPTIGGVINQFYNTARTAARAMVVLNPDGTQANPLDTDLRENVTDPDFARIRRAIDIAAQQERFR